MDDLNNKNPVILLQDDDPDEDYFNFELPETGNPIINDVRLDNPVTGCLPSGKTNNNKKKRKSFETNKKASKSRKGKTTGNPIISVETPKVENFIDSFGDTFGDDSGYHNNDTNNEYDDTILENNYQNVDYGPKRFHKNVSFKGSDPCRPRPLSSNMNPNKPTNVVAIDKGDLDILKQQVAVLTDLFTGTSNSRPDHTNYRDNNDNYNVDNEVDQIMADPNEYNTLNDNNNSNNNNNNNTSNYNEPVLDLFDPESMYEEFTEEAANDPDYFSIPKIFSGDPAIGNPASESIVNLINIATSKKVEIDKLSTKYPIPENCKRLIPPLIESDVWNILPRHAQAQDTSLQDVQRLVGLGISPLLSILSKQMDQEVKSTILDSIATLGNVMLELSIKRRLYLRRFMSKRYHPLCSSTKPVGDTLFGPDLSQRIREIDQTHRLNANKIMYNFKQNKRSFLGSGQFRRNFRGRGRSFSSRGRARGRFTRQPSYPSYQGQQQQPQQQQ